MSQAILNHVAAASMQKEVPVLKPGFTVRVHQRIKEGSKERVQVFEGLVIKLSHGTGVNRTFTVRRIVDGIGVEKIFPLYAPSIEKIEVIKVGRVRRSKLYYMRKLTGKSARLREIPVGEVKMIAPVKMEEDTPEEPAAEEVPAETPAAEAPVAKKTEETAPATDEKAESKEETAPAEEAPTKEEAPAKEPAPEEAKTEEEAPTKKEAKDEEKAE